ncbi:MAG: pantoate--beta-alanine ligase [Curvibacter sp. RIFCSPHIGHO2_12_FULL_63_18]|uniref:pantoate--beta-alanine ligase n=1 Tax=Rhodoferax sp. TaxID=50421 RepID=UPI0008ABE13A|nr:pantoate--beta-alanine ligase [Rhodoferax sp.]OGO93928.1 MAG: pantoate--beta-alanine ligase [Curvibacter sp. GWA2_63_95]OGP02227.1 MAG: pantoate--beta-alanine ligase [Curvibacter sp. RIFCSPHIGHO2_12_FULL_63_18]HCX80347.1 pantoate--beta-alanine ligase [Rhodoferax sp.]
MQLIHTIADLRAALSQYRHPAVVPTMGNLHAGHLALVRQAKPLGDVTISTIFVNRLQFAPHEDFDTYPRTLEADCAQLEAAGCDIVFAPSEQELYPQPQTFKVHPPTELADILEGHFRPGFFIGVCTVVMKLLACTQARSALFGKKDYQQLMVIRNMVKQFALPIEVVGGETQRNEAGLALSSRNGYLSPAQREEALLLSATLRKMVLALRAGETDAARLEADGMQALRSAGWVPDYVAVRRQADLQAPRSGDALVVLAAARLGSTRLIDNMEV